MKKRALFPVNEMDFYSIKRYFDLANRNLLEFRKYYSIVYRRHTLNSVSWSIDCF